MIRKYFFALLLAFATHGYAQTDYTVNSIPFQQYVTSSALQGTMDDHCSDLINLPFAFDYYGVTYNQIVISTNGYIDFRTTSANAFSPFSFNQTIPNANFPVKNAILGAYCDLNNSNAQGTITYGIYGTAPYRKFVVYFYNNSLFVCPSKKSTFQMILHETSNIIDVQLIDKQLCPNLISGRTVTGIIDASGSIGLAAPNRNTGYWSAYHEGWRFSRPGYYTTFPITICDDNADGLGVFDLTVIANDPIFANTNSISFYTDATLANLISNPSSYTNMSNPQVIYAAGNGVVKNMMIAVVDCTLDADNDSITTSLEDANSDGNLATDDTDSDGIPNYLDNDDDGDLILTSVEYVFNKNNSQSLTTLLDTDADGIPNYLDSDDDGDNLPTFMEDYDGDGNPANDDTNSNGTADYLEQGVALGLLSNALQSEISLYPNPASSSLFIDNPSNEIITSLSIYNLNGALIKNKNESTIQSIDVADLQTGIYFVKVMTTTQTLNYKFVKQ